MTFRLTIPMRLRQTYLIDLRLICSGSMYIARSPYAPVLAPLECWASSPPDVPSIWSLCSSQEWTLKRSSRPSGTNFMRPKKSDQVADKCQAIGCERDSDPMLVDICVRMPHKSEPRAWHAGTD